MTALRTAIPTILTGLCLAWLNHGLHGPLAPPTMARLALPYWHTFDGVPEVAGGVAEGRWRAAGGHLEAVAGRAAMRWPRSVPPRLPYRADLALEVPDGDRAALVFNAQSPRRLARSHRVVLERRGEDLLVRAEVVGRTGEAGLEDERLVPHPEARIRLGLQVVGRAYALRLGGEPTLAALPLKYDGGLIGLEARGHARFDSLLVRPAAGEAIAADRLGAASVRRVPPGWREQSGLWALEGIGITQRDRRDFDRTLMLEGGKTPQRLRLSFRHLANAGAGLVFNAPEASLEGGHLVRYADDGKSLFWGVFQKGKFKGQGYATVPRPGLTTHVIEVTSDGKAYRVKLDGKPLGGGALGRRSGRIGLTTSLSAAAFTGLDLTESGKRQTVLP